MYRISFHIRWCKSYPRAGLDRVQFLRTSRQSAQESGISCYSYYNDNRNKKKRRDHLKYTPGKQDIKELQKITILVTAHVLQKVQMQKYKIFIMGSNIAYTIYCNYRKAVSLCTVETWFLPGT